MIVDRLRAEIRRQRAPLASAALCAAGAAIASVALLGLSGWFITAAGAAGVAGPVAARAFNYMLPSAAIRLLAIVRTGARYGERLAGHRAAFAVLARIRPLLYRAIAAAPPATIVQLTSGEATARVVTDVGAIEMSIARRPARWGAFAAVVSGATLALAAGPAPALAVVTMAMATLGITYRLSLALDGPGRDIQRLHGELRDIVSLQFAAAPELRCYGMEDAARVTIGAIEGALADARRRQAAVTGGVEALCTAMTAVAAVATFALARPAGTPLAALCALSAAMAIEGLAPLLRDLTASGTIREALARLDQCLNATPLQPGHAITDPTLALPGMPVRRPTGSRIAITGPSGAGKTTLVEALIGLRPPPPDAIVRIGGRDIATLSADIVRSTFAWAPQDAQLVAGTVRENLLLARPDADDAALWEVLDVACLTTCIAALPDGLDAWIGEDGARLSGGERRRLSLARACLSRAPWLLLDEPTEALDAGTERLVVRRLAARLSATGQGLVVVTHRAAMLSLTDTVLTLDDRLVA